MRLCLALTFCILGCGAGGGETTSHDALAADLAVPGDGAPDTHDLAVASVDQSAAFDLSVRPNDLTGSDFAGFVCYGPGSGFPQFAADCMTDKDCFAGIHQIDCCGSHAAYGLSESRHNAFDAAEGTFRTVCPANCKCVARPTICDDGKTAPDALVTVSCDQGRCTSHGL